MVRQLWRTMASQERPGPAFIALRAAALGIDDISRQALREWLMEALDHRGQVVEGKAKPTEPATRTIWPPCLRRSDRERAAVRSDLDASLDRLQWPHYHAAGARGAA